MHLSPPEVGLRSEVTSVSSIIEFGSLVEITCSLVIAAKDRGQPTEKGTDGAPVRNGPSVYRLSGERGELHEKHFGRRSVPAFDSSVSEERHRQTPEIVKRDNGPFLDKSDKEVPCLIKAPSLDVRFGEEAVEDLFTDEFVAVRHVLEQ